MDVTPRFKGRRREIVDRLFPDGIPVLWCPSLTHFTEEGALDRPRMRAHLRFMLPHVRGFLTPGSTGEGWELSREEAHDLVTFMAEEIQAVGGHLLIGALAPTVPEMVRTIEEASAWLARRAGTDDVLESLTRTSVCGFTVCPPRGRRADPGADPVWAG